MINTTMDRNKGSKNQMFLLAYQYPSAFEQFVGKIKWISPTNEGHEVQLNNKKIAKELQLPDDYLNDFWPSRGPVWDGLAYGIESKTLFLIEAKAHLSESMSGNLLKEDASQKQKDNYDMKRKAIIDTMHSYGVNDKDEVWLHKYYQLANRLVFLGKMKELSNGTYQHVKLIYICFINDPHWNEKKKNPTVSQWKDKFYSIFDEMGLDMKSTEKQGVNIIAVDCKSRTIHDLTKDGK